MTGLEGSRRLRILKLSRQVTHESEAILIVVWNARRSAYAFKLRSFLYAITIYAPYATSS
jgi:hypothetical protein